MQTFSVAQLRFSEAATVTVIELPREWAHGIF